MKKTIIRLIALVFVVCFAFSLASCFEPKPLIKDLEKAAENLEDEDYMVRYTDDEDELSVGQVEKLTAYKYGDDYDDYETLTVIVFEDTKSAKLYYEAEKLDFDRELESYEIELKKYEHLLNKYEDDLDSDAIEEIEDEIKELEKAIEEYKDTYVVGRSGKTVWAGTKDAIEDSKG